MLVNINTPRTVEAFEAAVRLVEATERYKRPDAFGIGVAHQRSDGQMLDVWYPHVNHLENYGFAAVLANVVSWDGSSFARRLNPYNLGEACAWFRCFRGDGRTHPNVDIIAALVNFRNPTNEGLRQDERKTVVVTFIPDLQKPPESVEDAYLRLHLLSHRKVRPHEINLDGIFGLLPNVVWTNHGPIATEEVEQRQLRYRAAGEHFHVYSVDKFPRMVDYVVPSGVRIADGARVRLGAYLGEGTTVMPAGFVNFNAGTEGPAMVEGRISAGVFVGAGSDLGGGSSTQGTLSGGGTEVISIGQRCLIGAMGGIGISLGDDCIVDAGLYVTAGTKVRLPDNRVVKARELSGQSGLHFRRDSQAGCVVALPNAKAPELNSVLHANQ